MVNPWKLSELLGAGMEPAVWRGNIGPHPHRKTDFFQLGITSPSSALTPELCQQNNQHPNVIKIKAKLKFGFKNQDLKTLVSRKRKYQAECMALPWLFAAGHGGESGMETGTWELCRSSPCSCLDLGFILALPCKVAEGDEHSAGSPNLSRVTEEPWNDTQLTSAV